MLTGGVLALGQRDLKRLLAWSTVSVLGLLTLLLGLGTPIAARAFAVTLLAHAFYKATLFLVVGNVDHAAGTRDVERLSGLRRALPWTAAAAAAGAISMAGAPPLFGFLAKETAYEAALEAPVWAPLFGAATFATGVFLVFAAARVGLEIFRGEPQPTPRTPHEAPRAMRLGPVALAAAGLAAGLLVGPAERALVAPAAAAILQEQVPTGLALWHGFTPILALSAATLLAGAVLYRARGRVRGVAARLTALGRAGPGRAFDAGWAALLAGAAWQTSALQSGSLRRYLAVTLTAAFGALALGLASGPAAPRLALSGAPAPLDAAAWILIVAGALAAGRARAPLTAVACLGAVGFGVSLLFLGYSAPDLALTQLVIEVLTVILLVLVLPRLPRRRLGRAGARPWTLALAGAGGAAMAALTLLAADLQLGAPISEFFTLRSVPEAHGRNVVNVILVDFRALDTLGEITVLAVAALGVLALLGARSGRPGGGAEQER
jgi:multicomponent Na+:H+ antiporter subunit A